MMSRDEAVTAINKIFLGEVSSAQPYGAFVSIPGTTSQGLVHKTQISNAIVPDATEVLSRGDRVWCKIIGVNDEGKISLSMKVVNQGSGKDLDPNGVVIQQDENRRKSRIPHSQRQAITLEAVFNTKCSKCGTNGHFSKDCFQVPGGRTYELLPEIESTPTPQPHMNQVEKIMEGIDSKTQEKIRKKLKKEQKKLKKKKKAKKLKKQKRKKVKKEKKTKKKRKHKESSDSSSSSSSSSSDEDEKGNDASKRHLTEIAKSLEKSAHHKSVVKRDHSLPQRNLKEDRSSFERTKNQSQNCENTLKERRDISLGNDKLGHVPSSSRKGADQRTARDNKLDMISEKPDVRTGWSSSPESPRQRKRSSTPEFRRQMSRNPCQSSRSESQKSSIYLR